MYNYNQTNKNTELILCVIGGIFGLHYFYKENIKKGLLYLFTGGLFGIGWIIDIIKISCKKDVFNISITTRVSSQENPYENAVPHHIYSNAYIDRKQSRTPKSYVVFDTETTGLEPEIDKIIEISAIKYRNNQKVDEFSCLINPKQELDPYITQLTGIKQSDLIGRPTIDKILPLFFEFIEDLTLVAHNAPYDIKMLACECYRNNIKLCDNKIIDTVTLAKRIIPKERIGDYKLTTLKEYLGLKFKSHRALDDCETCARVYQLYLANTQKKKIIILDDDTGEILEEIN